MVLCDAKRNSEGLYPQLQVRLVFHLIKFANVADNTNETEAYFVIQICSLYINLADNTIQHSPCHGILFSEQILP